MTLIPQSFFSRTILLVLVPLIMALVIVANVFFGNHWSRVHATMARSLAGEMATITNFIDAGNSDVANSMAHNMGINITTNETLSRPKHNDNASRETGLLARELARKVKRSANIYMDKAARRIEVDIPQKNGTITTFEASLYRVYSTSTEVFIIWLIGTILIVSAFITPFLILHNRSIRRIAHAANRFGRGLDAPGFQPTGSKEIREAATAMITMKERLDRYNRTRTDMLNAVSHDLKSPLARMRLAIETDGADKEALLTDNDLYDKRLSGICAW